MGYDVPKKESKMKGRPQRSGGGLLFLLALAFFYCDQSVPADSHSSSGCTSLSDADYILGDWILRQVTYHDTSGQVTQSTPIDAACAQILSFSRDSMKILQPRGCECYETYSTSYLIDPPILHRDSMEFVIMKCDVFLRIDASTLLRTHGQRSVSQTYETYHMALPEDNYCEKQ